MIRTPLRSLVVASILGVTLALPASAGETDWPFGGRGFRGKDLYPLGLLGGKGRDANQKAADRTDLGGGRTSARIEGPGDDAGPTEIVVELLYPDGPLAKAGVKLGDTIVGVGRPFKDGSFEPLSDALLKAESKDGLVTVLVDRGEERIKVDVTIPTAGKEAAKPTEGAQREALLADAQKWLAERQNGNGGYSETLSGANGAVVQTAVAGLVWLAGGSDLEQGPYQDNVKRAAAYLKEHLGKSSFPGADGGGYAHDNAGKPSWNQWNWGYAHAAIFLGELQARTPDDEVKATLHEAARVLCANQEKSGGWAHGRGGPNALGYLELNIVTGLALMGIGLAEQSGFEVPEQVVPRADEYLKSSSSGGGVGYSAKPGQAGQGNIGRTACAWMGYVALGMRKAPFAKQMEKFINSNAGDLMHGHASLLQHVMLGGMAAHAIGKKAKKEFWEKAERDLVLARAPDGSFQPRAWHESLGIGSNSDVSFGEVWSTSVWALVLGTEAGPDRPGLPAIRGDFVQKRKLR